MSTPFSDKPPESASFVRHRIFYPLRQMKLVLVRPREPCIPCLVRFDRELTGLGLLLDSSTCCDLILVRAPRHPSCIIMLMLVMWEDVTVRCFVNLFVGKDNIYLGSHVVRVIQRAWRRYRERRRLALCMGWRNEGTALGRVLRTLCVDDLRRMVV